MTTLQLEAPNEQLVTVGTQGMIESTLNISAGNEGGRVVWEVEEVTRSFSEEVSECAGEGGGGGAPQITQGWSPFKHAPCSNHVRSCAEETY